MLNGIPGERLNQFLSVYYNRKPTQDEIMQVKFAQKLVCFVSATAYFDFPESKKDRKLKRKTRLANLDKLLQSNEIKPILESIRENEVISIKSRRKDEIKQYAISCYKEFLEM